MLSTMKNIYEFFAKLRAWNATDKSGAHNKQKAQKILHEIDLAEIYFRGQAAFALRLHVHPSDCAKEKQAMGECNTLGDSS